MSRGKKKLFSREVQPCIKNFTVLGKNEQKKKKENSVLGPEELREVYVEQLDKPKAGKLL